MKQVDEQKKKKQREKHALEQAELTLLKQQQEKWKEEDAREFQTRQREKEERLEAYRKYKLNDCQKAVQEDKETVVGNFFFRGMLYFYNQSLPSNMTIKQISIKVPLRKLYWTKKRKRRRIVEGQPWVSRKKINGDWRK